MIDKIKIIDKLVGKHPAYGVEKGWSTYTGGFVDSGTWNYRKLLDVPEEDIQSFLIEIEEDENRPRKPLTEDEQRRSKIIISDGRGLITQLQLDIIKSFCEEVDRNMLYNTLDM